MVLSKLFSVLDPYLTPGWEYVRSRPVSVQCVAGVISLYVIYRMTVRRKYKLPPGPQGLPLLGNLLALVNGTMADRFKEWRDAYGPVVTFYFGPMRAVVLNNTDVITEALVTRGSDFSGRPQLYSLETFSEGFRDLAFSTYGDTWKFQRKVTSQSVRQYLTGDHLQARIYEAVCMAEQAIKNLDGPFELSSILGFAIFNYIHGLCFGSTKAFDDPEMIRLSKFVELYTENSGNGFFEDIVPFLRYWPTKAFRDVMSGHKWFNEYITKIVATRRATLEKDSVSCLADTIILAQQELVEADSASLVHMTDVHTRQVINDIFGAGVETTRSTLDWVFLVLVASPDIQARMHQEIDKVVGKDIPGREHRVKLVYTEAVILETMRLHSAVPLALPHETIRDTSVGGYDIPAGTTVLCNQLLAMRDPKHWDDPMTFNPERFMSPDKTKVVLRNRAFLPFSMGHRSCPGESLARLQLVYLVTGLLQRFSFSLPHGQTADFTANTKNVARRTQRYHVIATPR